LEPIEDIPPRRGPIPVVKLIEIDMVGAETAQARGERLFEPARRVVARGNAVSIETHSELRCDRHILAPHAKGLSQSNFRLASSVAIRGVEQGDSQIDGGLDRTLGLGRVYVTPGVAAELIATEAEPRELEVTERDVLHVVYRGHACWGEAGSSSRDVVESVGAASHSQSGRIPHRPD